MARLTPIKQRPVTAVTRGPLIIPSRRAAAAAALTPVQVLQGMFGPGDEGALYVASEGVFVAPDDMTPAALMSPAGYIADLSGNAHHGTQATVSSRPVYRELFSGYRTLFFDGVDDFFDMNAIQTGGPHDFFFLVSVKDDRGMLFSYNSFPNRFIGVIQDGVSSNSYDGTSAPTVRVNGATIGLSRAALASATLNAGVSLVEYTNVSFAAGGGQFLMKWPGSSFRAEADLGAFMVVPSLSASQRGEVRAAMLELAGGTWGAT